MSSTKRKVSISLDENLVEELEREAQGLSAQVNMAVRAELERRHRLLMELLDRIDAEHGPMDESLVEKYVGLLRGLDGPGRAAQAPQPGCLSVG